MTHTFLRRLSLSAGLALLTCATATAQTASDPLEITIYPILVRAPIFGASIDLPSLPSAPPGSEGGEQSGSTGASFNSAYMVGGMVQAPRWFGEFTALWAALSAERETPRLDVGTDVYFYTGRGGVRVGRGFAVTGGFRRVTADLDVSISLPQLAKDLQGSTKKGLWDPLIGLDWRGGKPRMKIDLNFQGGGFGVGSDVDVSVEGHASFRIVPHVDIRLGYTAVYYKMTVADVNIGSFERTLISTQTLHGPEIGVAIVF